MAARKRGIKGKFLDTRAPEWEPLLELAPEHVADFMWMGSIELSNKTRLQLYKHYWNRDYIHLDGDGRAFFFNGDERYEEIEPARVLSRVLDEHTYRGDCFDLTQPGEFEPDRVKIEWPEVAGKNGVSRERAEFVVRHCGLRWRERSRLEWDYWEDRRSATFTALFVGEDEAGVPLEVAALPIEPEEVFVVFYAAELRDENRYLLRRAERWSI